MSQENKQTLQTYSSQFEHYIRDTTNVTDENSGQGQWLKRIFEDRPKDSKVLEIGSAFGRDAKFIENLGYTVEVTDAYESALNSLRDAGFIPRKLDILEDEIGGKYDVILAAAVFLHFTEEDIHLALSKVGDSLNENGVFAFSLKQGEGDRWSNSKFESPRYFRYWSKDEIEEAVTMHGFKFESFVEDIYTNKIGETATWFLMICSKVKL